MLNGCHDCWSYKAIKFAFEAKLFYVNPDICTFSLQAFNEVCNIIFYEDLTIEYMNSLYERRFINYHMLEFARKQHRLHYLQVY